jgi:hypothetical protein
MGLADRDYTKCGANGNLKTSNKIFNHKYTSASSKVTNSNLEAKKTAFAIYIIQP